MDEEEINELKQNFGEFILNLLGVIFIILYSAFVWGFIYYKFYYWFVIPNIPTLPNFSYLQMTALGMFSGVFFKSNSTVHIKKEYEEEKVYIYSFIIFTPWIMLLTGWFVKLFI